MLAIVERGWVDYWTKFGPVEDTEGMFWHAATGAELEVGASVQIGTVSYQADFTLRWAGPLMISLYAVSIVIEADGHEFHERTKEQAARDRSRDRAFASDGWIVLRFTGAEIHSSPENCADEIHMALHKSIERFRSTEEGVKYDLENP